MKKIDIPRQTISGKNIYLVVSAAKKMDMVPDVIEELLQQGTNVSVILTDNALKMLDYLFKYRHLICTSEFDCKKTKNNLPEEDIVLVLPCTFNMINKLASGISDNYATTLVATAIGNNKRIILVPAFNKNLWDHPQTMESISKLERWGLIVVWPIITSKKVTMMDYEKVLDRLYIEESKILFDSEKLTSKDLVEKLKLARKEYYQDFVNVGKKQKEEGTNSLNNGNYSVKLEDKKWMLITSTGSSLDKLSIKDLTLVNLENMKKVVWVGDKMPSCDTPMHIVYYNKTNTKSIAHSHCSRITYDEKLEKYRTPNYTRYGKFDIIFDTVSQLKKNKGFLILRYHGEIGIGDSLKVASSKISRIYKEVTKQ